MHLHTIFAAHRSQILFGWKISCVSVNPSNPSDRRKIKLRLRKFGCSVTDQARHAHTAFNSVKIHLRRDMIVWKNLQLPTTFLQKHVFLRYQLCISRPTRAPPTQRKIHTTRREYNVTPKHTARPLPHRCPNVFDATTIPPDEPSQSRSERKSP